VNLFQRGAASMGRLNKILDAQPALLIPEKPTSLEGARGALEFQDVTFVYPSTERPVLNGVNFSVEAGQTVAIVGPTGSGKSTLIGLLARLYDPTSGRILLDGQAITDLDPEDLRRIIGMVPQDSFLFSDTIEGNIGLGLDSPKRDASPDDGPSEAVARASRISQLHDQIEDFPDRYETMLGERGINLSGGQKQRATLARAVARDPIILVLDDALSAVDTHTEAKILDDLRTVMEGRTSFIISHRVSAVMNADLIIVLEDGVVVERGVHTDLIAAEGTYARLLQRQLLEEEIESETASVPAD
jgi:ATP-binding cassette subfamily B multidrug efflux pump